MLPLLRGCFQSSWGCVHVCVCVCVSVVGVWFGLVLLIVPFLLSLCGYFSDSLTFAVIFAQKALMISIIPSAFASSRL